jgi:hypothetical protein
MPRRNLRLSTLENPLLYRQFLTYVSKANPDIDIDPEVIDRTLEYDEAFNALKKIYPSLQFSHKAHTELDHFRDYLLEFGIESRRIQNLIIQDDKPFTEEELAQLSYVLNNRPARSVAIDKGLAAKVTKDLRKWMKNPNRLDLLGIDSNELVQKCRCYCGMAKKLCLQGQPIKKIRNTLDRVCQKC